MKILIIGANGQLGSDLVRAITAEEVIALTHKDVEIRNYGATAKVLDAHRPDLVINTAAYHKVDECEKNVAKSFAVNAFSVRNLALCCWKCNAVLVHMSTDYVFDGRKREPYIETDTPNPINVYGMSKLVGEYFVRSILDKYYIVRTSGLYGAAGSSVKRGNFVKLMLRLARERDEIRVVNDQILAPTYTVDLAERIKRLIYTECFGLYHITNTGACSWHEFARKIFELCEIQANLIPITTEEFGAAANRPKYSVLGYHSMRNIGMDDLRSWDEALRAYLAEAMCEQIMG